MTQASDDLPSVTPVAVSDAQSQADKTQARRMYFVRVAVCLLSFGFVFPDAFNG